VTALDGAALVESLERRFRTVRSRLDVAGREMVLLHPESAEDLIDERDFEHDERLPYWAEIWPSSRVLAAQLVHALQEQVLDLTLDDPANCLGQRAIHHCLM